MGYAQEFVAVQVAPILGAIAIPIIAIGGQAERNCQNVRGKERTERA